MASYYWIKLYHEILEDPKMALLPDRLWRRVVELFLLAGRHGNDGNLPETRQIAWELRQPIDDLDLDMRQIETTGIVTKTTTGWTVTNFQKRQLPSTNTQRSQEFRKRHSNQDATQTQRKVAQSTDIDIDKESESCDNGSSPLSVAFVSATSIPELTGGPQRWFDALTKLKNAGVEPTDVTEAVKQLRDKGYNITSLSSIVNPAISVMSKRKSAKSNGNGNGAHQLAPIVVPEGWKP